MNKVGDRIELIRCTDTYVQIPAGTLGFVTYIDEITHAVTVQFDTGHQIGLMPGEDRWNTLPKVWVVERKAMGQSIIFQTDDLDMYAFAVSIGIGNIAQSVHRLSGVTITETSDVEIPSGKVRVVASRTEGAKIYATEPELIALMRQERFVLTFGPIVREGDDMVVYATIDAFPER